MVKKHDATDKPFDGAISRFVEEGAPPEIRKALKSAGKNELLDPRYPYRTRLDSAAYAAEYHACQLELVRAQSWMRAEGKRLVVVLEGRDAAGKGGAILALTENLNPRHAKVVALAAPSETERGQWYFQRYVEHLPTSGQAVLFDRSWYNRAIVEHVFGFCTEAERERFFQQVPEFEDMLVNDGITLIKVWIEIGRAEQLRQFLQRERDPLKQWKLSQIDVDGLGLWDEYAAAIAETFARTNLPFSPWTVVWGEDKRRARLAIMQAVLGELDYPGRAAKAPDAAIVGGPELIRPV